MALLDNRIESRRDCVLGIARGNLAYSRFMFSVYPQYALSLETKDLDQVLAFVHEFERSDLMKPGNKVFSITYLVAYALTSSHHSIDYKKKEYIDDLFSEVGSVEGSKFATIKPIVIIQTLCFYIVEVVENAAPTLDNEQDWCHSMRVKLFKHRVKNAHKKKGHDSEKICSVHAYSLLLGDKEIRQLSEHHDDTPNEENQLAFVPGRCISDNILLTHELMHIYHLDHGVPRCAFKVDIQKAYDTVDWGFLRAALMGFGFRENMVVWIMECVTTTSFFISINGSLHGHFKGKRGLRKGDPISPYLFTIVMEVLTLMLKNRVMPFEEGRLLVKYLGVPLVPSRLVYKDCKELVEKVEARINDWKSKSLSIVGSLRKGRAKVAWDVVCLPKAEGGLGIRRLECFNKALMAIHILKLLTMKDSLWVAWIHLHKIKNRNFWDLPCRGNMSWDGGSPLADFISTRDMFRARLNTSSKVADVIVSGTFSWPHALGIKYPNLLFIPTPIISVGVHDKLEWRLRHAFNLWLVIKGKLKTQDNLRSWDVSSSLATCCTLCETQLDSHEHLFFDCSFSKQVWCHMRDLAGLSHVPPSLELILDIINPMARRKMSSSIISKLVLAASAYFIWQDRNDRLFKNNKKSAAQIIECITSAIHLKFMSCRFKKFKAGLDLMKRWKIPEMVFS
nr:hypothetical protein [Tanacetum cinerariifolium]